MPQITHLQFKRRRPERFLVQLDNGDTHLFSPEIVARHHIAPGKTYDEAVFQGILAENGLRCAKDQMLRYLTIRPHSAFELQTKTARKGYAPEIIARAVEDLQAVGLIDDLQFCKVFVRNELLLRPAGRRLISEKLRKKGVPAAIFEPVLEEAFADQPQEEIIKELAAKFLARQQRLPRAKRVERLIRHLQNKGFQWDLIKWVMYEEGLADSAEE